MHLTPDQSELLLKYFNEDAPVLFFLLSEDGVVLSVNRFCRELLGTSVTGQRFGELLVDFQQAFRLEDYLVKEDHSLLSLSMPNSLPRSFLFSFHNVDRKILVFAKNDDEELERLSAELLHVNQELNNTTRSLCKNNARLAHLNTVKNQFLGMATHDLRQPITIILNYAEILTYEIGDQLEEEYNVFLSRIKTSALFMKRLVDDFLDISAIEAGRFQLDIALTDPAEILKKNLVLARIQADKKKISLEVEVETGLPEIPVDANKIEQAINNVLVNAIEHSQTGTQISVSLNEIEKNVVFSVQDRGTGMSREAMKQLFDPFSKTGAVKTGGEKSTGLGLAISRKIIEAHKGKITAVSQEGAGTTLTIYLPAG